MLDLLGRAATPTAEAATSSEIDDPWVVVAVLLFFVGVVVWAVLGRRLRKDYRKADQARLLTLACLVALAFAAVIGIARSAWYVPVFAAVFGAVLVRDIYEQRANRLVATRMEELRAADGTAPAKVPVRAAPAGVPPMGPIPIERFSGESGLRQAGRAPWVDWVEKWRSNGGRGRGALGTVVGVFLSVFRAKNVLPAGAPISDDRPVSTAVLWVFDEELEDDVVGLVKRLGPITFLRGGGVVSDGHLRDILAGRVDEVIDATEDEVRARVETFDRSIGAENSLLCSDAVWKLALDLILDRSDLVVMDVRTFSERNLGCEHEFGAVLDRFPASRFVLITGKQTDDAALEMALGKAWATLAADSPNRSSNGGALRLVECRNLGDSDPRSGTAVPQGGTAKQRELATLHQLFTAAVGRSS